MTPLLVAALFVFVLALVHASLVNGWRSAFAKSTQNTAGDVAGGDPPLITVIVPARNEADALAPLLQDLYSQSHSRERTEVLVIDDNSEDGTATVVKNMMQRWPQLRSIGLRGTEGKKAAITEGVRHAKGELILVSDADGRCGPHRSRALAERWRATAADMILMPVHTRGGGFLGAIQEEEQLAFLGAAAGSAADGSPLLANGANMAFTKVAFEAVGGYSGDGRASGDDLFLLTRMRKAGRRIVFLLDAAAVVEVEAERTWKGFFSQRLRWAGKMRGMQGPASLAGAFAIMLPLSLIALTVSAFCTLALGQGLVRVAALIIAAWLLWIVPVVGLINEAKGFLGIKRRSLRSVLSLLVFPIYAVQVALTALFIRPIWKDRKIRSSSVRMDINGRDGRSNAIGYSHPLP